LYARDPAAAINLATEKYSYTPESVPASELVVHPDAPGGGKAPIEPFVSSGEHEMAVTLGHGVVAIGAGRYLAAPTELTGMHEAWGAKKGSQPSAIHYDLETNTSHFDMEVEGKRVRVEAQLAIRLETFGDAVKGRNQVVGGRISHQMGETILRGLAGGEPELLKAAGLSGDVIPPGATLEFGLGKTDDGYVIVVGEPNAVDWSALPGIDPISHTHPLHAGNDLPGTPSGAREVSIPAILEATPVPLVARELVFPSAEDFVVAAMRRIVGSKVFTGFVVDNGVIRKPVAGETATGIEFTIGETVLTGTDAQGKRVFESTIEGKVGNETPISKRKIWIIEDTPDGHGHLYMTEPTGVTPVAEGTPTAGTAKTKGALSPKMRSLAKAYGTDVAHWAMEAGEDDAASLAKLDRPLRSKLMDIPASDARDLLSDATQARIQRALASGKISAADLVELHARLGKDELNARLDGAGRDPLALEKLAQRAMLEREILGKPFDEGELNERGYHVDKNGVIYRPAGGGATMEPLKLSGDKVVIGEAESAAEVQARVYAELPGNKQTAFDAMQKKAAAKGVKVRLVEGVFDTGATWQEVFGTGTIGEQRVARLRKILTSPRSKKASGGAGLTDTRADELINGLLNRKSTIKVVIGTDPVRTAHDYREGNATGSDEAHHFDPSSSKRSPRMPTTPCINSSTSSRCPTPLRSRRKSAENRCRPTSCRQRFVARPSPRS